MLTQGKCSGWCLTITVGGILYASPRNKKRRAKKEKIFRTKGKNITNGRLRWERDLREEVCDEGPSLCLRWSALHLPGRQKHGSI